jgi:hypothetical protein
VDAFYVNGEAYGRAISFLAHHFFGYTFGTAYDISTMAILWFAGSSAMTGLLALVPRYLPRYGMAPEWAKATRPLTAVLMVITLVVTWWFEADVEQQAGAYAAGVLALMTSGALAVTIALWKSGAIKLVYLLISVVFVYAITANILQRPEGLAISLVFIGSIITTSFVSRALRSTELRVKRVVLDEIATRFIEDAARSGPIRIVANRPDRGTIHEYKKKEQEARESHHIPPGDRLILLEVQISDASEFSNVLEVAGHDVGRHRVLRCESPAVPNAIAALLLHVRDMTNQIPHIYFGWTEGNPLAYVAKFIVFGEGDTAPVTREVLRQVIGDPAQRPRVHVG